MPKNSYDCLMSITGKVLRSARHANRMTQSELAGHLDVSVRTVANWEGAGVPERSEQHVAKTLGLTKTPDGGWVLDRPEKVKPLDSSGRAPDEREEDVDGMASFFARGRERASGKTAEEGMEGAQKLARVLVGARDVVALAEVAAECGARPETVMRMIESAIGVAVETGAGAVPGPPAEMLVNEIIARGAQIASDAVDNAEVEDFDHFHYELGPARKKWAEKKRAGASISRNVGRLSDTAKTSEEPEIPENVEEEWGLAAHPRSEPPQDHTP